MRPKLRLCFVIIIFCLFPNEVFEKKNIEVGFQRTTDIQPTARGPGPQRSIRSEGIPRPMDSINDHFIKC